MKTTPETEAEIVRLHYAEHWPVGAIATQIQAHPDVVRRVLGLGEPRAPSQLRPRIFEPYRAFIDDTLHRVSEAARDPALRHGPRARLSRLGAHVRKYVALVRPRPKREAFLVTETAPRRAGPGRLGVRRQDRRPGLASAQLWLFVIVLAHSRAMWAEFVIDLTVQLARGARSSAALPPSAASPGSGSSTTPRSSCSSASATPCAFTPSCSRSPPRMHVEPELCAVRMPQQKGKVERAIRYLRERFLAGRTIRSVEHGNRAPRLHRPRSRTRVRTRRSRSARSARCSSRSRRRLLALPDPLPETARVAARAVDRQDAFARFDTNRYSVPTDHAEDTPHARRRRPHRTRSRRR